MFDEMGIDIGFWCGGGLYIVCSFVEGVMFVVNFMMWCEEKIEVE